METRTVPKLLTPGEVAEVLGVAPDTLTVWRCTQRYDLPFVKVGRRVMYKSRDLEKFISSRTMGATA